MAHHFMTVTLTLVVTLLTPSLTFDISGDSEDVDVIDLLYGMFESLGKASQPDLDVAGKFFVKMGNSNYRMKQIYAALTQQMINRKIQEMKKLFRGKRRDGRYIGMLERLSMRANKANPANSADVDNYM